MWSPRRESLVSRPMMSLCGQANFPRLSVLLSIKLQQKADALEESQADLTLFFVALDEIAGFDNMKWIVSHRVLQNEGVR